MSSFAKRVMESVDRQAAASASRSSSTPLDAYARGEKLTVLMVCMGNICRSPTAEVVLRRKLIDANLADDVLVDSAGTHAWHRGEPPDARAVTHARRRGYDLRGLVARPIAPADYEASGLILAMDWDNLSLLEEQCPPPHRAKLGRLTQYARHFDDPVVPDPYQGGAAGFEHVLDLVEDACDGIVAALRDRRNHRL